MYKDIGQNKRRTIYIMTLFVIFVVVVIYIFVKALHGSLAIFYGGVIGAFIYTAFSYYGGAKMALAVNRAKQVKKKKDNPRLWRTIENLAITDGLPMPAVYIMNDPSPNAFATGRDTNHAAVCVTSGLLDIMEDNELQGVIAHELSHIKNYDVRVNMIAFALTAIISLLADIIIQLVWFNGEDNEGNNQIFFLMGIVAAILAPIVAMFIQLAISRQREYLADASGALTTRYPEGLISALEKISRVGSNTKVQNTSTSHLFFANPLKKSTFSNLFSTHPPIKERIKRLEDMEGHA